MYACTTKIGGVRDVWRTLWGPKMCDNVWQGRGLRGVKIGPKYRDVLYGRPLAYNTINLDLKYFYNRNDVHWRTDEAGRLFHSLGRSWDRESTITKLQICVNDAKCTRVDDRSPLESRLLY